MDAVILRSCLIVLSLFVSTGARYQTPNFIVTAESDDIARKVGIAAEEYRRDLAEFWLDRKLPNWSRPCKLKVKTGSIGAGGETKFQFVGGEVLNWDMYVQGTLERILDSVLPHEVNHTIFACHYRRPLPRWADEGAATLFEHRSEQLKQLALLKQVINSNREFIELPRLLTMKEYPKGYRPMLIMYAEGYALADFLVQQGGRARYLKLLADGERIGWTKAIRENYAHGGVEVLEKNWKSWILAGMPKLKTSKRTLLVNGSGTDPGFKPTILQEYESGRTVRSQSPDNNDRNDRPVASKTTVPRTRRSTTTNDSASFGHSISPAGSRTQKSHARVAETSAPKSGLFRGFPGAEPSSTGSRYRSASLQAPQPRQSINSAKTIPEFRGSGTSSKSVPRKDTRRLAGHEFERTTHVGSSRSESPDLYRKHLPQERRLVTGSVPQWAGFPGQKELF